MHRPPSAVVRPGSAEDVAAAVRWAAREGRRVAAQGQRHTVFGRAQVGDGVAVDMRGLRTVHEVRDGAVVVDAGATWREVLAATLPTGSPRPRCPTTSTCPSAARSSSAGSAAPWVVVSDTVLALDVVTGRAETRTCSPTRDADLFDAVRAGLGQVGILTRATLPLVPAPRRVRRFLLHYPDLRTMLDDQRRLVAEHRFDAVQGAVLAAPTGGWTFRVDVATVLHRRPSRRRHPPGGAVRRPGARRGEHAALPGLPRPARPAGAGAARQRASGSFPHPWLTTFVGDAAVEAVVERELGLLRPADLGAFGQVALSPVGRPATPLLRLPADGLCFAVNLLRFPDGDDVGDGRAAGGGQPRGLRPGPR